MTELTFLGAQFSIDLKIRSVFVRFGWNRLKWYTNDGLVNGMSQMVHFRVPRWTFMCSSVKLFLVSHYKSFPFCIKTTKSYSFYIRHSTSTCKRCTDVGRQFGLPWLRAIGDGTVYNGSPMTAGWTKFDRWSISRHLRCGPWYARLKMIDRKITFTKTDTGTRQAVPNFFPSQFILQMGHWFRFRAFVDV